MPYEAGTPIRENLGYSRPTTVHINRGNYEELRRMLKAKRYNFSHFMDNLITLILMEPEILDLILEEKYEPKSI